MRVGIGFDAHRLVVGRPLFLGGVKLPHNLGLIGHSDADVILHAIIDAIFGAAAIGDLGQHFPDTDPRYKGISSVDLLVRARQILRSFGYQVVNIDALAVLEEPRIAPFRQAMREKIANALNLDIDQVSVKATTTEGLGFTGERDGVAAQAVALIEKIAEKRD